MRKKEQGTIGSISLLWLVSTLGVVHLWLISTAVEALRNGTAGVLLSTSTASLVLLLVNGLLLRRVLGAVDQIQKARTRSER